MNSDIPIENIYYLLCYAWNKLDQGAIVDVKKSDILNVQDLLVSVLCNGVKHLASRGLAKGYEVKEEVLAGVRGRIDITSSISRSLLPQGQVCCHYDELTADIVANRIIRTTLGKVCGSPDVSSELRKKARASHRALAPIEEIKLRKSTFSNTRVNSQPQFYKFVLNVCELLFDCMVVDEATGFIRFRDFSRDDRQMARLFQTFLLNFAKRECPQWSSASVENIPWLISNQEMGDRSLLPRMQTDISLRRPGEHLIIEAKFYRQTLSTHFDVEKFHNANLYQLLAYVLNTVSTSVVTPRGMLLYPNVGKHLRETYEILGRQISVCTIDLARPWRAIDQELRALLH